MATQVWRAEEEQSKASSSHPTTPSRSRTKSKKQTLFRMQLEQGELPLSITQQKGDFEGHLVRWTRRVPEDVFGHYLTICIGGVQDTLEPYPAFAFDAAMGLLEELQDMDQKEQERLVNALPQIVPLFKQALRTREHAANQRMLLLLQQIAICAGEGLTEYHRAILPLCSILQAKHRSTDSTTRRLAQETYLVLHAYARVET